MKILFVSPSSSAYDVLTDFSRQLFEAVHQSNQHAYHYVASDELDLNQIMNEISEIIERYEITHVLGFNAVCFNLFNKISSRDVKLIGWLVDHPSYHFKRLSQDLDASYIFSSNSNHASYVEELTSCHFASSAVLGVQNAIYSSSEQPLKQREFDIVFVGGWMGEPVKFWQDIQNPILKKIAKSTLEELLFQDQTDPYTALKKQFLKNDLAISENSQLINAMIMNLNDFQRKYSRLKMMSSVVQSGLKTLVVGNGWSDHFAGSHLFFHDPVPNEFMSKIYENCKIAICLNSNNGGCERALQAIANGSSVFSFGGVPIEELASKYSGISITPSWQSEMQISTHLKKWHEQIMTDSKLHPDPIQFTQENSWSKVSERLFQAIQHIDLAETV